MYIMQAHSCLNNNNKDKPEKLTVQVYNMGKTATIEVQQTLEMFQQHLNTISHSVTHYTWTLLIKSNCELC